MNNEIKNLINEFKKIAKKKWIRSISSHYNSIGLTFENELSKKPDSMYFPDFQGIELKCTSRYSNYPLYLFTIAFDGPTFPEINRIVENYGAPDKDYKNKKVIFANINNIDLKKANSNFKFAIDVDRTEEKLYLLIYDLQNNLIERKSFVYFYSIYNHLMLKLRRLALIKASKKSINNIKYYRYYKISIYELISFDNFINLIDKKIIKIDLISRISKSGDEKGRYRNKNLVFSLNKKHITQLFNKITEYNIDINKKND